MLTREGEVREIPFLGNGMKDHAKYLWGNAAYTLAQRITNAFSMYGWTAAIRGYEGGSPSTSPPPS